MENPNTTTTTNLVTLFFPRLDSADTLLPGTAFHSRASIPMYNIEINANGTIYELRKKDI